MPTPPRDSHPSSQDDAGARSAPDNADTARADSRTESQSAYLREQHRDDAAPGDASADVHEVRLRSNYQTRRADTVPPPDDGAGQACQSAFTRAEERVSPTRDPDATR